MISMALDLWINIATHSQKTALNIWMLAMYIQQAFLMSTTGCTKAHCRPSTGNASSQITCIHRMLITTFELELAGDPAGYNRVEPNMQMITVKRPGLF